MGLCRDRYPGRFTSTSQRMISDYQICASTVLRSGIAEDCTVLHDEHTKFAHAGAVLCEELDGACAVTEERTKVADACTVISGELDDACAVIDGHTKVADDCTVLSGELDDWHHDELKGLVA